MSHPSTLEAGSTGSPERHSHRGWAVIRILAVIRVLAVFSWAVVSPVLLVGSLKTPVIIPRVVCPGSLGFSASSSSFTFLDASRSVLLLHLSIVLLVVGETVTYVFRHRVPAILRLVSEVNMLLPSAREDAPSSSSLRACSTIGFSFSDGVSFPRWPAAVDTWS